MVREMLEETPVLLEVPGTEEFVCDPKMGVLRQLRGRSAVL